MALLLRNGGMPQIVHRPTQFDQGRSKPLPAPYGGINLRSDITALQPNEARILENFLPNNGDVRLRPGQVSHAIGLGSGEVKTLASFIGLTAQRVIAGANGKLWDVTSSGSATELATGFADDRWQTALYNNRLQFVNGTDTPKVYDGSTISNAGWSGSGLTATNLCNVAIVRNRLWFCENNSADVWYGGIGSITGTLVKFQLSQIAAGGVCMAIGSWSRDAGDGADDATVFAMSTGELIVYQGDPASDFSIAGKYAGGEPIGRQCLAKIGGELIVTTRLGLLPLSAAVGGVALDLSRIDPWGKVAPGIVNDAALSANTAGWNSCLHLGTYYLNVPQISGAISKQWVLNTRNSAFGSYSGLNYSSACSHIGTLYFGAQTGGVVFKHEGSSDNGAEITAQASCAFVYPTASQAASLVTAIRPKIQAEGSLAGRVGVNTDFVIRSLVGDTVTIVDDPSQTPWGSPWGSPWGRAGEARPLWYSITGEGRSVGVRLQVTGISFDLRWFATDLLFKPGGIR